MTINNSPILADAVAKSRRALEISTSMMWRSGSSDDHGNVTLPTQEDGQALIEENAQLKTMLVDLEAVCSSYQHSGIDQAGRMFFMHAVVPAIHTASAMVAEIEATRGGESLSRDRIRTQVGIFHNCLLLTSGFHSAG